MRLNDFFTEIEQKNTLEEFFEFILKFEIIRKSNEKVVIRFETQDGAYYGKFWIEKGLKRFLINSLKGGKRGTRELNGHTKLSKHGFCVPEVVRKGEKIFSFFYSVQWYVTKSISGFVGLDVLLTAPNENYDCVKRAAEGLIAIHRKGLCYGDYNFENVMLDKNNNICYLDWMGVYECNSTASKLNDVAVFVYEIIANSKFKEKNKIISAFVNKYVSYNTFMKKDELLKTLRKKVYKKLRAKKIEYEITF